MKRTLLAIVAAFLMMTSAYAQRLANVRAEATLITDKMVLELGLSKAQRNGILNINLNYLNGIRSYRDIDSYGWECRNRELRRMLTARQWQRFKEAYYFYRPIEWRDDVYVHNIYHKYPKHHKHYKHYDKHHKHCDKHYKHYEKKHHKHHKHYDKHHKHYDKHHKHYDKHHKHYDKRHKHYDKRKYGKRDRW
ncbi:hypothetical protein [Prevotella sp.]|uniref:hypothetical protein n=1 Tax=Prevotella sp. TaxID=59823 RepID=UPI003AB5523A